MPSAADRRLSPESGERLIERFTNSVGPNSPLRDWPLIVLVDDSAFCAARLNNFLWMVFTRSDPASDVHGIDPFVDRRHWGCRGPVVIDARIKPWMAPPLVEDPEITRKVDALAAPGGPLHGIL
jgi:4-hydroxy-3-polyprenylbenzoate decarboxylase